MKEEFRLKETFIEKYKTVRPPFGFNGLGELTYMRTYSRIKEDGTNESWWETIRRVVEGTYLIQKKHITKNGLGWNEHKGQRSAEEMYDRMFNMKFLPPGRGLWAMGTSMINERGLYEALNNCSFVSTKDIGNSIEDSTKPFEFLMDVSMLGVGVGFDVKGAGKIKLRPYRNEGVFVIPDTREGWVESVKLVLKGFFSVVGVPTMDVSQVRAAGEPIRTFGGTSSGPEPLQKLHQQIIDILSNREGEYLNQTDIVDIMNMIGCCVVAGNVRRCLPKGTLIHCIDGLKKIEDIKKGDIVHTSQGTSEISELVYQGKQDTVGVKTQLGVFECTAKHQIAVMNDIGSYIWKKAIDIQQGDRLVFPLHIIEGKQTSLPEWSYNKPEKSTTCKDITIPTLDSDSAWFLGIFHGDGNVHPNFEGEGFNAYVSVASHIDHISIIDRCTKEFQRFGINTSIIKNKGNWVRIHAQSKQLAWYFSNFKKSKEVIEVPQFIIQGTPQIRASYLAGVFDADGSSLNKPTILVCSQYEPYIKQLQAVYASLGIPTRIDVMKDNQERVEKGWNAIHLLKLVGQISTERCEQLVMCFSEKYKNINKSSRSQNDFGFPSNWIKGLRLGGINYHKKWSPTSDQMTVSKYIDCGGDIKNLIPIKVIEVTPLNQQVETYDISVPRTNEFIAQEGLLVHNTAEIVFGEADSEEYLALKDYRWDSDAMQYVGKSAKRAEWGWTSNNSVFAKLGMNYERVATQTALNGEPGYIWMENVQKFGRMNSDSVDQSKLFIDKKVAGSNPCNEQSLESYELCCLVETFPTMCSDLEDYHRTLKYAYLYAKTVTLGQTSWPETNRVMLRNRRIGTSQSGIVKYLEEHGIDKYIELCDTGYKTIQYYDEVYSQWLCIPRSIKTTSIKPSGTVSLLPGVPPGMHYPESNFYIRRIRMATSSLLIQKCINSGYHVEADVVSQGTSVVSVPVSVPGVRTVDQVSIWEQLSLAALIQKWWADNQVSCTVTFNRQEGSQIKSALNFYQYQLKGISFLPKMEKGAYAQMPYEAISEEVYKEMYSKIKPMEFGGIGEESTPERFCDGDTCVL